MKASLRHLRIAMAVADTGSVTLAAGLTHVSQPAVSAALRGLEGALAAPLFDRRPSGLTLTVAGAAVMLRLRRAFGLLDPALADLAPRLTRTTSMTQLTALIAVAECESFSAAARRLGLAQPSVHRAISQMEDEVGRPLFDRTAHGVIPTRAVRHLAVAARLAMAELDQAAADVAAIAGREVGRVVIGAMPLSRSVLLGPAIAQFRQRWKTLPIRVVEGPYADLALALRRGEVDMLVGALRQPVPDLQQEALLQDEMAIVARPDHPLAKAAPTPPAMSSYPWVVAPEGTPARDHFTALFRVAGTEAPTMLVETGSMTLLCDLVSRTDHLGYVSALQITREVLRGTLTRLPHQPQGSLRPIGLTTRQDWHPTQAQAAMMAALRQSAQARA